MRFKELKDEYKIEFKKQMIISFQTGFENYTGKKEDQVLPERDIDDCLNDKNGHGYMMLDDNNQLLGGLIVNIDEETNINHLDFIFVVVGSQSKGIGEAMWHEVEKRYPKTKIWRTCTPYFDRRNIHFYVNKLKFKIIEFWNAYHPDPNMPDDFIGDDGDGMFEFEKII